MIEENLGVGGLNLHAVKRYAKSVSSAMALRAAGSGQTDFVTTPIYNSLVYVCNSRRRWRNGCKPSSGLCRIFVWFVGANLWGKPSGKCSGCGNPWSHFRKASRTNRPVSRPWWSCCREGFGDHPMTRSAPSASAMARHGRGREHLQAYAPDFLPGQ